MSEAVHPWVEPFRTALRGLAASVTVISTQVGGVRYGMVATAVMSLSMEPPSLAVAINAGASIHDPLLERRAFVVNILSEWDERMARGFAKANGEARFGHGAWSARRTGEGEATDLPYLASGQASIFCRIIDAHRSGSHTLFVGEVEGMFGGREKRPLVYCDGGYGGFAARAPQLPLTRQAS